MSHTGGQAGHNITIPLVDLAPETHHQVIVERQPGQYLGHPSTVLLGDNKTILCVYPLGHGEGGIVLKRSPDGGATWSERLPVPDNRCLVRAKIFTDKKVSLC